MRELAADGAALPRFSNPCSGKGRATAPAARRAAPASAPKRVNVTINNKVHQSVRDLPTSGVLAKPFRGAGGAPAQRAAPVQRSRAPAARGGGGGNGRTVLMSTPSGRGGGGQRVNKHGLNMPF